MTKAELNARLATPLTASKLKKTSLADLQAMVDAQQPAKHDAQIAMLAADLTDKEKHVVVALADACMDCNGAETVDDMLADNMTWADVADLAQRTGMNQKTVKGVLGSLTKRGLVGCDEKPNGQPGTDSYLHDDGIRVAFELLGDEWTANAADLPKQHKPAKTDKPAKQPTERKQRVLEPHVYCQPVDKPDNITSLKAGSKKHKLAEALFNGATMDELCEAVGWNKSTVQSAFSYDMKNSGFGVERRADQKYYLLVPKGLKRLPVMEQGQSRADALVAACN